MKRFFGMSNFLEEIYSLSHSIVFLYFFAHKEYTELCKEDLHDPDNHDGVITQLKPDILECEVKWALESILWTKLEEVMEFHLSYFKS